MKPAKFFIAFILINAFHSYQILEFDVDKINQEWISESKKNLTLDDSINLASFQEYVYNYRNVQYSVIISVGTPP